MEHPGVPWTVRERGFPVMVETYPHSLTVVALCRQPKRLR